MPTFFRKSTSSKRSVLGRKFSARTPKKSVKKSINETVIESLPSEEASIVSGTNSSKRMVREHADATIHVLDSLLNSSLDKSNNSISNTKKDNDNAVYQEEGPQDFNGINNASEQREYLGSVIDYERKKAESVEEQIKLLEKEKEDEKKLLQKEIRSLKEELHRTNPIHANKFFSLSKELRTAIDEIQHLAEENGIMVDTTRINPEVMIEPTSLNIPVVSIQEPARTVQIPDAAPVVQSEGSVEGKKGLPKKKLLITGASAVAVLIIVSGVMAGSLTGKANVNQKLVDSYLENKPGQVQGVQTNSGVQTTEVDPSQASVSFEQCIWEEFKDTSFGIMLQFPKNAVKAIRTDSSVTFIRKTGYLFKVQRIQTALTPEEYWKQIKATSLNFDMTEDTFKGKPAIKLELKDVTDYPGDRYLIKEGEYIYDIWYATPSNNFEKDDILRAEKMLASLNVIGSSFHD
jgi:hypothetical protein